MVTVNQKKTLFNYSTSFVFLAAVICIFVFYSNIFSFGQRDKFKSIFPSFSVCSIQGKILSSPAKSSSGKTYHASLEAINCESSLGKCKSSGKLNVYIPSEMVEAYFPGKLYSAAKTKGAYLFESGGIYTLNGKFSENGFYVQSCSDGYFRKDLPGKISYFRAKCRLQFKRLMYSWGKAGGLLLALLCGAREYTDNSMSEFFKRAGLSHILALSGMHLSMFSGIALFLGNKIGRKKLTFIIRVIALVIFVWFAGLSPSLLRAFICSIFIIIATVSNVRQPDMLIILAFSFLMQSSLFPEHIHNSGFILSYGALCGILIANKMFYKLYSKLIPKALAYSVASSSSAQFISAPVSLKLFGSFAPAGIIAAVVVSPVITIFIYSGLVLILLSMLLPVLSVPSGIFMNFLYTVTYYLVKIFAKLPVWSL